MNHMRIQRVLHMIPLSIYSPTLEVDTDQGNIPLLYAWFGEIDLPNFICCVSLSHLNLGNQWATGPNHFGGVILGIYHWYWVDREWWQRLFIWTPQNRLGHVRSITVTPLGVQCLIDTKCQSSVSKKRPFPKAARLAISGPGLGLECKFLMHDLLLGLVLLFLESLLLWENGKTNVLASGLMLFSRPGRMGELG